VLQFNRQKEWDMISTVEEYVNQFDGIKKQRLETLIEFMRTNFPEARETISYQMPMFKLNGSYVAFSAAKNHYTFHTLDFDLIEELKTQLPRAKFGKGSAKVPYDDEEALPVLFEYCRKVVERSRAREPQKPARGKKAAG